MDKKPTSSEIVHGTPNKSGYRTRSSRKLNLETTDASSTEGTKRFTRRMSHESSNVVLTPFPVTRNKRVKSEDVPFDMKSRVSVVLRNIAIEEDENVSTSTSSTVEPIAKSKVEISTDDSESANASDDVEKKLESSKLETNQNENQSGEIVENVKIPQLDNVKAETSPTLENTNLEVNKVPTNIAEGTPMSIDDNQEIVGNTNAKIGAVNESEVEDSCIEVSSTEIQQKPHIIEKVVKEDSENSEVDTSKHSQPMLKVSSVDTVGEVPSNTDSMKSPETLEEILFISSSDDEQYTSMTVEEIKKEYENFAVNTSNSSTPMEVSSDDDDEMPSNTDLMKAVETSVGVQLMSSSREEQRTSSTVEEVNKECENPQVDASKRSSPMLELSSVNTNDKVPSNTDLMKVPEATEDVEIISSDNEQEEQRITVEEVKKEYENPEIVSNDSLLKLELFSDDDDVEKLSNEDAECINETLEFRKRSPNETGNFEQTSEMEIENLGETELSFELFCLSADEGDEVTSNDNKINKASPRKLKPSKTATHSKSTDENSDQKLTSAKKLKLNVKKDDAIKSAPKSNTGTLSKSHSGFGFATMRCGTTKLMDKLIKNLSYNAPIEFQDESSDTTAEKVESNLASKATSDHNSSDEDCIVNEDTDLEGNKPDSVRHSAKKTGNLEETSEMETENLGETVYDNNPTTAVVEKSDDVHSPLKTPLAESVESAENVSQHESERKQVDANTVHETKINPKEKEKRHNKSSKISKKEVMQKSESPKKFELSFELFCLSADEGDEVTSNDNKINKASPRKLKPPPNTPSKTATHSKSTDENSDQKLTSAKKLKLNVKKDDAIKSAPKSNTGTLSKSHSGFGFATMRCGTTKLMDKLIKNLSYNAPIEFQDESSDTTAEKVESNLASKATSDHNSSDEDCIVNEDTDLEGNKPDSVRHSAKKIEKSIQSKKKKGSRVAAGRIEKTKKTTKIEDKLKAVKKATACRKEVLKNGNFGVTQSATKNEKLRETKAVSKKRRVDMSTENEVSTFQPEKKKLKMSPAHCQRTSTPSKHFLNTDKLKRTGQRIFKVRKRLVKQQWTSAGCFDVTNLELQYAATTEFDVTVIKETPVKFHFSNFK